LGHYLAWVCAGIMGAAAAIVVGKTISQMDAGGVAWQALGVSGIIAVLLAGWTTSNPTLYRAGLAFQAVTPGWPRWLVTLVAGIVTTIMACFPFVFVYLLNFVALYGLLLMPVGAIVFIEHWIFPRIGLAQYWAARKNLVLSWPALLSWGIAIAVAMILRMTGTMHEFFVFLPTWFITAILYTLFAAVAGAREKLPELVLQPIGKAAGTPGGQQPASKKADAAAKVWGIAALASLAVCLVLAIWVYVSAGERYEQNMVTFKSILIWVSVIHFVSATAWAIKKEK
jgi:cytosine permease